MYDELVKRLRMRARLFKQINQMENCIMDEAADAIEKLSVVVRAQKAVIDKLAQQLRLETENGEV